MMGLSERKRRKGDGWMDGRMDGWTDGSAEAAAEIESDNQQINSRRRYFCIVDVVIK